MDGLLCPSSWKWVTRSSPSRNLLVTALKGPALLGKCAGKIESTCLASHGAHTSLRNVTVVEFTSHARPAVQLGGEFTSHARQWYSWSQVGWWSSPHTWDRQYSWSQVGCGVHLTCETGSTAGWWSSPHMQDQQYSWSQVGCGVHLTCKASSTAASNSGLCDLKQNAGSSVWVDGGYIYIYIYTTLGCPFLRMYLWGTLYAMSFSKDVPLGCPFPRMYLWGVLFQGCTFGVLCMGCPFLRMYLWGSLYGMPFSKDVPLG